LQAENDRLVPSSCIDDLKKCAPLLEVKRIKAPHFILQAQPQACLDAIEEFISLTSPLMQK
jgi:hypothetical protein